MFQKDTDWNLVNQKKFIEQRRQVMRLVGISLPVLFLAACKENGSNKPKLVIEAVRKDSGKIGDLVLGPHMYVSIQGENIPTDEGAWVVIKETMSREQAIPIAYMGPASVFSGVTLYGTATPIEGIQPALEIKPLSLYTVTVFEGPPPGNEGQLPPFGEVITKVTFLTPP